MTAKALHAEVGMAGPGVANRGLSALDGPLSHLLAERNRAELELVHSNKRLETFLVACDVKIREANGTPTARGTLTPAVRDWLEQIELRAKASAVRFSGRPAQRAD